MVLAVLRYLFDQICEEEGSIMKPWQEICKAWPAATTKNVCETLLRGNSAWPVDISEEDLSIERFGKRE